MRTTFDGCIIDALIEDATLHLTVHTTLHLTLRLTSHVSASLTSGFGRAGQRELDSPFEASEEAVVLRRGITEVLLDGDVFVKDERQEDQTNGYTASHCDIVR